MRTRTTKNIYNFLIIDILQAPGTRPEDCGLKHLIGKDDLAVA
jgi:hypothetical protein